MSPATTDYWKISRYDDSAEAPQKVKADEAPAPDGRRALAVVGCGPKALAIAAKAKILAQLGIPVPPIHIFERANVAAYWDGKSGYTDGLQHLGTPPEKDLGFPYTSLFGREVDGRLLDYSWQFFLIDRGRYGEWIDRGRTPPRHKEWSQYLAWACERIRPHLTIAEVTAVSVAQSGLVITFEHEGIEKQKEFCGVVFTGPGEALRVGGFKYGWNEDIMHGASFWRMMQVFKEGPRKVAVIGSGETAASIVLALINLGPGIRVDLINRHGTVYTRGESYHENRLYTDPAEWLRLDEGERQEFIRRTDRGVFSVAAKKQIDLSQNIRLINGNVEDVRNNGCCVQVKLCRGKETVKYEYDKVVIAIGFDATAPFQLLRGKMHPGERAKVLHRYIDWHLRIPDPSVHTLNQSQVLNVHLPMLAALAQGPGFPNLSCLGTLSDRILSAYVPKRSG